MASGAAPSASELRIGTAGWSIPKSAAGHFASEGSGLERYASRFSCVEINSSFYRPHRPATYVRWAASVPPGFRFSVKLPRAITHQRRLADCSELIGPFIDAVGALGDKLELLLVQLPPSLVWEPRLAGGFFDALRSVTDLQLVCEPRHPSWFGAEAEALLERLEIARVAADPARVAAAAAPGGWSGLAYYRLHGSPAIYRSSYDDGRLDLYAGTVAGELDEGRPVWCIFDNTASFAAVDDALKLQALTSR